MEFLEERQKRQGKRNYPGKLLKLGDSGSMTRHDGNSKRCTFEKLQSVGNSCVKEAELVDEYELKLRRDEEKVKP